MSWGERSFFFQGAKTPTPKLAGGGAIIVSDL